MRSGRVGPYSKRPPVSSNAAPSSVKASEMGQLAGYLEEGFDDSLAEQSADSIRKSGTLSHILTFFEWEYGVLPYSKAIAALLPNALLSDQRSAVLRMPTSASSSRSWCA